MSKSIFDQLEQLLRCSTSDSPAQVLQELGAPTATIAILDDGEISSHCISSTGDDNATLFQACSISKPAAVAAALRLVEEGYFKITDHARGLLPPEITEILAEDSRTEAAFNKVTVAQLMSHTAGLSVSGFLGYPYGTEVPDVKTLLGGKKGSNSMKIGFCSLPGAEFIYSGGGLTILQCVMEHVTKMSFPDIIQKYILDPLDMKRSFYVLPNSEKNVSRCFYQGYRETEYKWNYLPEQAAAGLWTTPTDLLKLVRAMQDSLAGKGFLKKDTAEKMLTRITKDIGLGWAVGHHGFCHTGGNFPGWRCFAVGYSDLSWNAKEDESRQTLPRRSGIAVMTNSFTGLPVVFKLCVAIAYLKGWPMPPINTGSGDSLAPLEALPGTSIGKEWKEWVGQWGDKWRIASRDGNPVAGVDEDVMLPLKPVAMPSASYGQDKSSIDLLVDGTELMLRLGWKKEKRIVELWVGATGSSETLERG